PAWNFYRELKHRMNFEIWAEGIETGTFQNLHPLKASEPETNRKGIRFAYFALGGKSTKSQFSSELVKSCESADLILLCYRGGTDLVDFVVRNWGTKTLLHPTDNFLLANLRSGSYREAAKSLLEQIHYNLLPLTNIIFVSEADRRFFTYLFPWHKSKAHAVPLGVDIVSFCPSERKKSNQSNIFKLLFTGDLSYPPNDKACAYILQHILPKLPLHVTITFAGRRPPDFLIQASGADSRINVTGYVDDISQYYQESDAFVAPIFQGAGMQNKLLEASACGLPCITSSVCAKAFRIIPPNFMIADKPQQYIDHINRLTTSTELLTDIGRLGRNHIINSYSWLNRAVKLLDIAGFQA
ncbi:MAG: glycosyltransferase family 4 protein, partial [Verrucomicrobiota bacterium]